MYLEHFGLSESPFRITPHTDFFFGGANRGATLDALLYAVTHDEGIIKISGEVGSGKTMLCRVLMERLPEQVAIAYLSNPSLSREDILYAIADELSIVLPGQARPSAVLRALQEHLIRLYAEGKRVVVLIDEAHAMPAETLEEIRLLSNLESNRSKLLQLVLFGQPELNDILARPDMRQLKERITHNFLLEPLVRDDIAEYMEFRMRTAGYRGPNVFSPSATRMVAESSKGLTRRINMLADKTLLAAFSENTHQITAKHVRAAIKDCEFSTAARLAKPLPWKTLGLVALLLVMLAAWITVKQRQGNPPPTPVVSARILPATESPAAPTPDATPAPQARQTPPAAQVPEPSTAPANPQTAVATTAAPAQSLLETHIEAGKAWLASADNTHWFLQLYSAEANQKDRVEAYLREARDAGSDMSKLRVYFSDLSGKMRYGIIYGEYPSAKAAANRIRDLPQALRVKRPYPRQVLRLR